MTDCSHLNQLLCNSLRNKAEGLIYSFYCCLDCEERFTQTEPKKIKTRQNTIEDEANRWRNNIRRFTGWKVKFKNSRKVIWLRPKDIKLALLTLPIHYKRIYQCLWIIWKDLPREILIKILGELILVDILDSGTKRKDGTQVKYTHQISIKEYLYSRIPLIT